MNADRLTEPSNTLLTDYWQRSGLACGPDEEAIDAMTDSLRYAALGLRIVGGI